MNTTNLLLIFTRNPELGKCKTRLAATIGDQAALTIYKFLLSHTVNITKNLNVHKEVQYSVQIREHDIWDATIYDKKQQQGTDLGARMEHAFAQGFAKGFENIVIIGSDLYDLNQEHIEQAFEALTTTDYVIGPAIDGGYYLLGMKSLTSRLFANKKWGTASVLKETLVDLTHETVTILEERNDVDVYEDIKDIDVFQQFLST